MLVISHGLTLILQVHTEHGIPAIQDSCKYRPTTNTTYHKDLPKVITITIYFMDYRSGQTVISSETNQTQFLISFSCGISSDTKLVSINQ